MHRTCCFTGHRQIMDDPVQLDLKLRSTLESLICKEGLLHFIAGGALGFDCFAAKSVLTLQKVYPDIQLHLVLPCENQTAGWPDADKRLYDAIRRAANEVTVLSPNYYRGCMQARNRYMVDHSSICICYRRKDQGGTVYTQAYASKKGRRIILL